MVLQEVIKSLSDGEKIIYDAETASEYFRFVYYSQDFIKIDSKLKSNEKLSDKEWDYLIKRLFLVTVKAIGEEDSVNFIDKLTYILNRAGTRVFRRDGKLYNECIKMVMFIDSISYEKEINEDLLQGLEKVEKSKAETELDILLRQHREASYFRDNQDAFCDSYKKSRAGNMTDQEIVYMNCMDRAYNRQKELVKEYDK